MTEPISKKDLAFIEKRRKLVRWFNPVGLGMIVLLAGLTAWLFWAHPRLVNPLHVAAELEAGTLSRSMVEIMAVIMPMVVLGLLLMTGVMIAFTYAMIANERRYLKVIDQFTSRTADGKSQASSSDQLT